MDKFTKMNKRKPVKEKNELLYDGGHMKVMQIDNWSYIEEPDSICVLPIIIEDNQILVRMEVVPSFQVKDNKEFHLTCIAGTIEKGEDPKDCLVRELEEEAGIVLKDNVVIEFFDILYKSKSQSSRFHLCILPLNIYSFDEVVARGDGSKLEKMSKTVRVNIKSIKSLFPSDIVTKLLLEEGKKYLNL